VLLLEGGVRVGDELEVDGMMVRVERIDLRSTRVMTRFGNLMVIPNGLISGQTVRNFTQGDSATLIKLDVGVAYGSNVELVRTLLTESANADEDVIRKSETAVLFNEFADSSLLFTVYFWIEQPFMRKLIASNIRFRIDEAFRANGVRIPFPQRDIHLHQVEAPVPPPAC
jgi:small-conductance mechanosensitive channel